MYKQIIIARKDLDMSPGKLAAQVSHGSMAFLTTDIREHAKKVKENYYPAWTWDGEKKKPQMYRRPDLDKMAEEARAAGEDGFYARPVNADSPCGAIESCKPGCHYEINMRFDTGIYEEWISGIFTKCVLKAKNKNHLLKAKKMAEELGMVEGKDFFLIKDNCLTELEPEEDGRTLTVIGFRPMPSEIIDQIGKKYQLYT